MQLYDENGYLDIPGIIKKCKCNFIFITGGRGTGKTYGGLKHLVQSGLRFAYWRRTQTEIDEIFNEALQPFKQLNKDFQWNYHPLKVSKSVSAFYPCTVNENGKLVPESQYIGLIMAVTTIANIRGFDGSDIECICYDEFIPEEHKKRFKGEADALFNGYETINRNRELQGKPPVQLIAFSNSNDLANPLYMELNVVNKVYKMRESGQEVYIDRSRSLCIITLDKSPISTMKQETALYKLTKGTRFSQMAIENKFEEISNSTVKSMPLIEYKPIVTIGEITIYEHKSRLEMYVSSHRRGTAPVYGVSSSERRRVKYTYNYIWIAYLSDKIIFESVMLEVLLTNYFTDPV